MPLYEYKCKQCKKHTEKIQKFSDPEITECPHCKGPLERVISAAAISFKGGGWFKDGYGSKRAASKSESSKSDSSGGSGSSSGSAAGESKSESAAPAATASTAAPSSDKK